LQPHWGGYPSFLAPMRRTKALASKRSPKPPSDMKLVSTRN
jgi:hypothetical protein